MAINSGCALHIVRNVSLPADASQHVVVGRLNYIIDGREKTPYGAFAPRWPAPFMNVVQLESGEVYSTAAVDDVSGAFAWPFPPGHYVVTRIGVGTFTDDTYIAWPRLAFVVPEGAGIYYLGDVKLIGSSPQGETKAIRYRFEVDDNDDTLNSEQLRGQSIVRALMVHRDEMPIGDQLSERWQANPQATIEAVFGLSD